MAFLSSMNIAGSGMTAQRLRLDVAAENIVNMNTTRTENGAPYRRKVVLFEAADGGGFYNALRGAADKIDANVGVRVAAVMEDTSPLKMVFNPTHPDADEDGYVSMPNVDLLTETTDSMAASRAYEANVTVFNAIKLMASKALEIGK